MPQRRQSLRLLFHLRLQLSLRLRFRLCLQLAPALHSASARVAAPAGRLAAAQRSGAAEPFDESPCGRRARAHVPRVPAGPRLVERAHRGEARVHRPCGCWQEHSYWYTVYAYSYFVHYSKSTFLVYTINFTFEELLHVLLQLLTINY